MDLTKFACELRVADERHGRPAGPGDNGNRLADWRALEPDVEILLSTGDSTGAWITLVLCKRYGVTTFQPKRARHTTIGVRAPKGFVVKVLEPHVKAVIAVFAAARAQVVGELADSWLGAEANGVLTVDEHA
jgi:hypothetical protein